jgi:hypothetical protein
MRHFLFLSWTLLTALWFAVPGHAADPIKVQLKDEKLPLQEIRPLDRRVWILTLEGDWKVAPIPGKSYYINLLFPNGQSYDHRPLNDSLFRLGEISALLQNYQLRRNGLAGGGTLQVVVSEGKPVVSASDPEVVSNVLQVSWPMDRPIVQKPPQSRFSPPPPVDPFPPASPEPPRGILPPPKPEKEPVPPPKPGAEPAPPPKPDKEPGR